MNNVFAPIVNFLKGKKTYLVAAATILTALAGVASGEVSFFEVIDVILLAVFGTTLRDGINTAVAKIKEE